ncbi:Rhodanese-related sulfurtransferase [Lachnospiraceae bacterium XBB1006]|nr:Rhodanese-related sulfurtransferase [Lachnospiraceae bacterium XBB1006]
MPVFSLGKSINVPNRAYSRSDIGKRKKRLNEGLVLLAAILATRSEKSDIRAMNSDVGSPEPRMITPQEALQYMKSNKEYALVDVRMPEEYAMGHIPGAMNIPLETIVSEQLPQLPDLQQTVLLYCHGGSRSQKAGQRLCAIGYTNVYCFGGIDTWTGSIVK